jgi:flagellar basal-body rod modification protein FlgD
MTIGSISGVGSGSSLNGSASTIAGNFDSFLKLLTTQLKNQNPLDPLDTNQFTQQLVQFSSVEQQLKTNQFMESLLLSNQVATAATTSAQAVAFIGKEVSASTTLANLENGNASWLFNMSKTSSNAIITIKDSDGNTVFTDERPLVAGEGRFDWDGIGNDEQVKPDGVYQIQIDAKDSDGNPITATTEMIGVVDGVDFTGDEPFLVIGKAHISMASVSKVYQTK